jgi:mono/diheme cytochrome c family protein
MTIDQLSKYVAAPAILLLLAVLLLDTGPAPAQASVQDFDAAATFKGKCAMCHGQKAEKSFDPAKEDAHHVEAILKGLKSKPPMPAYEGKGINEEQAKALVAHMRSLKQ